MYSEQLTQALAVVGHLDPVSQGAGNVLSEAVDMSKYHRLLAVIQVGAVGAGPGTVDAKLRDSATSGGSYSDISGKAITQISASNKIATIELRPDEMNSGAQFCKLSLTVGTNAVLIAAILLGAEANHKPGNAGNIATVTQQVT
jgi:hypothetical protein